MKNKRFTKIYEEYRKLVMKIAYDSLKDRFLAEEICQQVFISFYEHMDEVKDTSVKSWLIVSSRNAVVEYLRKQKVMRNKTAVICQDAAECLPEGEDMVVERIQNERLSFQILDDLRDKNREWYEIVVAVCIGEMSQKEAAEMLGMTIQVLRAKLYRAKQYIRRKYYKEYRD